MQVHSAATGSAGNPRCSVQHRLLRCGPVHTSDLRCFHVVLVANPAAGALADRSQACNAMATWPAAGDLYLRGPGEAAPHVEDPEHTPYWAVAFHADALGGARSDGDVFCLPADDLLFTAFARGRGGVDRSFAVSVSDWPRWVDRLTSLERELGRAELGSGEAACALLTLLLIDVARVARPQLHCPATGVARPMLARVFRFIEQRFRTPIGLADVAKSVARSPSYLTDLVRRETGRTVLQWIIERRMTEARRLLTDSEMRVKDIGRHIGYDDTGYFIRQFHRVHGAAPQHWRSASRRAALGVAERDAGAMETTHEAESLFIALLVAPHNGSVRTSSVVRRLRQRGG